MKIYCPYCRKEVDYNIEKRDLNEFKGISINTYENVAICKECNNDLYVNKLEDENNKRIYSAYRRKANIIQPQDIIKFRNKYNISQRELTNIIGFGKMTINRYERGGLPTKSQSDYIRLLINNEDEFIKKTKESYEKNNINQKTFDKIMSNNIRKSTIKVDFQEILKNMISEDLSKAPNIYNGYKKFDLELVENIISYIASKVKNLTLTSLNKYLWFIDALSFNQRGVSITGITYQHQQYGPTIIEQKYREIALLDAKYTKNDYEDEDGTKTYITSNKNFDLTKLSKNEIEIIDTIIQLLKDKNVKEISNMSHEEDGWKKTKRFENISFEHTMNLNIIQ